MTVNFSFMEVVLAQPTLMPFMFSILLHGNGLVPISHLVIDRLPGEPIPLFFIKEKSGYLVEAMV